MTANNEHLDRAIEAGMLKTYGTQFKFNVDDHDRTYARALIAHIIDYLSEEKPMSIPFAFGYGRALDDIREIAGIERERIYEHNDGN